jgi:hypothetical protein
VMIGTVMFQVMYGKDADRLPPRAAAKVEKTVAAAGTVRQETLNKISKADERVTDEELWEDRVERPAAVVDQGLEPLGLVPLDDEPNKKAPSPGRAVKPAKPAAAPKGTTPQKPPVPKPPAPPSAAKPATASPAAKPAPAKPAPAKPAAPADDEKDEPFNVEPIDDPAGKKGEAPPGKDDDLDDFFNSMM